MEVRPLRESDLEQAWELDQHAFHTPAAHKARFLELQDPTASVGAFDDGGRLAAMWAVHPLGQFFGGHSVPMGGVHSVAVVPHRRGEGLARQIAVPALEAMRGRGQVISTLFPAMMRLYRGLGWEVAGSHVWRRISPRLLQSLPRPQRLRTAASGPADLEALRRCYEELARHVNGFLDRPDRWWDWIRRHRLPELSVFLAEEAGRVTGYLVYRQLDGEYGSLGGPFRIAVEDCVWTTRAAGLALWRLLGSWAPQVDQILYRGGAEDPLLLLSSEQDAATLAEVRWMTRMVDVAGAIAARGFPHALALEVPFQLDDAQLPSNSGAWILQVADGRGRLERGGDSGPRLDVGAFSSLYTGWATTATLARVGRLAGGTPEQRASLDTLFAGPTPWMMEEF